MADVATIREAFRLAARARSLWDESRDNASIGHVQFTMAEALATAAMRRAQALLDSAPAAVMGEIADDIEAGLDAIAGQSESEAGANMVTLTRVD